MAIETKQLHALSKVYLEAVYGGAKKEAPKDTRLVVTAADKKANTKAYQNYKAGNKAYKAADHLKNESAEHRRNPEGSIKQRFKSKQTDPSKAGFTGIGDDIGEIMRQNAAMKKAAEKKTKKEGFSDWRQDLKEIPDYEQIPASSKKRNEKISEKSVKNTVKINPEMKEEAQVVAETEIDEKWVGPDEIKADNRKWLDKRQKKIEQKHKEGKPVKPMRDYGEEVVHEGVYEKQKTKEVMGALKKRDLKKDVKKKIAADIVKKKGDTSKSDDRYAYEDKLWDQVAANLTELGEMNDVEFRVVGLDEAERDLGDRLHRKRKLYDKTTKKAMQDAMRTGEASGHNRFNMSRLEREMDKVKDKMKKEK